MTISAQRIQVLQDALEALRRVDLDLESPASGPALEFLLRGGDGDLSSSGSPKSRAPDQLVEGPEKPVERAAQWAAVDQQALLDIVDFNDDGVVPTIFHARLPNGKAERQRTLALLKLGLDKVSYGREELQARQVNEVCDRYECLDQNLPTNLQRSGVAKRSGERGSYTYRITLKGSDQARAVVRELLGLKPSTE